MITEPDLHKSKLSFFESKQGACKCYSKFGLYHKTSGDCRGVILVSFKYHFIVFMINQNHNWHIIEKHPWRPIS